MSPPYVDAAAPGTAERAAEVLRAGGVVALPTETVYGIATLPAHVGRLFVAKGRPASVPVAVLVADLDQAAALVELPAPGSAAANLAARCWPGPLTLVLPARPGAPDLGGGRPTVGVRCPDHDLVRAVAALVGPVATTSANRHGEPTPASAAEVAAALGEHLDLVLDGGPCTGVPSTVVDATDPALALLREGALSAAEVAAAAAPGPGRT